MGYEFRGEEAGDWAGFSVSSAGDVDGDGLADLLIGAQLADGIGNAETWSGSTYLIKAVDLAALDAADGTTDGIINLGFVAATGASYEFVGADGSDFSGSVVRSAGDLDGDGLDDLLIHATNADTTGFNNGSVYVVNATDLAALDAVSGPSDGIINLADVAGTGSSYEFIGMLAIRSSGTFNYSAPLGSVGDLDGDGRDEFLIGSAPSFLINGADLSALDAADGTEDGIIEPASVAGTGMSYEFTASDNRVGFSVSAAGDVDGDGQTELLFGLAWANGISDSSLFVGRAYLIDPDDLAALDEADGTVDGSIDFANVAGTGNSYEFIGVGTDDRTGWSISAAGDVNGDGVADFLIGALQGRFAGVIGAQTGTTYLISGADLAALDGRDGTVDGVIRLGETTDLVPLGTGNSYVFRGQNGTEDQAGYAISAAGDIDGDGLADLLIGAPQADGIGNASPNSGSAYLISGADLVALDLADGVANGRIDLDRVAGVGNSYEFIGSADGGLAGFSVSLAGDVDGDGRGDLLISAPSINGAAGSTYLIEADQLAFYDARDGEVDGVINLANIACFLTGTRIATPCGARPVEALVPGDPILTADGSTVPVRFVLRQTISTRFGPAERLQPVRVQAGALGGGLPERDLVLTADHALLIDGLLINAGALVNGGSIDWVPVSELGERFTVWHVETEAHDIILAEGAPAETFIDYVGRQAFDNYAEYVALYGEERLITEAPYPRISTPRLLPPALKARLAGAVAA